MACWHSYSSLSILKVQVVPINDACILPIHCTDQSLYHLGHLYVKSDVYGFGVVLLEMLSGQRALDANRPSGQHKLVDWAKPFLADRRKLARVMDPRLEGQYPSKGALQAAQLTLRCLSGDPKSRPSMEEVVQILEHIESLKTRTKDSKDVASSL